MADSSGGSKSERAKDEMEDSAVVTVYGSAAALAEPKKSTFSVKVGLAQMLRGGVIMDVVTPEQARIAEEAGACAVMALERVPADIRAQGGVARMSDPGLIKEIKRAVTIPVMAKARIGHFVEALILETVGVDYVDESEVLTPADDEHHINKYNFRVPFVCGCRDLGEALRRIREGAAMIRTKGRGRHRQRRRGRPPCPLRHGPDPRPPQHGRR
ncbi:putative pyridoxal 5'-phosphate synthase subunit PdxS/SNZ, aldolase-type TIM barrel [Dioscorea sansibarensis]